uniref:Myosin heavy chain-like protein n=1 Tax=Oryza sativa subsp. japonica TaxID=39947 RepID=Q6ZA76_ORYSJ|nr:myosin heavy chain-like protein [Oryza sativa Japonica Group]
MISGPTTASNVPVPLCEKGAAERDAAINTDIIRPLVDHQVAASLKEKIAKEASDAVAAAATTSGGNVPKKGRKFSSVVGHRRKTPTPLASDVSPPPPRRQRLVTLGEKVAWAKVAQDGFGGTSSASPAVASTDVVVMPRSHEATPSGPASDLVAGRAPPVAVLTWECSRSRWGASSRLALAALAARLRRRGRRRRRRRMSADRLARDLAEVREDLQKMRELVAGNERQWQGLEHRISELENHLSEIRGSLRVTYTGLHQLVGEFGVKATIPANPDEFSLTSSLAELVTTTEAIPSKHAARIGEETSNGIYTGACHVLADVDVEDVQQRGQPKLPVIVPALAFEPHVPGGDVDQSLPVETSVATTPLDLESALADQDRRIQYWRTKFEVAELERTMLEVKKDQAVETLRGREVWFNSYLKSCCTSMSRVCRELRVPRGDPEESAAGYISWLNGACAQLEGIGQRIDEALKQECRRSSRYAGGHVLACIRDHRPQLHHEFLREGFSRSRRTPTEIDGLAKSMAPLAEKVFQSMDWRWPSW